MKKKILNVFLMCAFVLPCLILLSACGGGKKVQSITVDGLFVGNYAEGNYAEYQYGTSTDEIFSIENMKVTVVYTDNSTKVLNSDEYSIEFKKNSELIDEIKTVPDVGYYEINVYYDGFCQGGSFNIIRSETPYYTISLPHKAWTYGEEDIPEVSLANYQLQEGDSVDYYYIEKSVYDNLSKEEKRYPNSYAYDWTNVKNGDIILDAGQYYVFADITFINESNHIGLTVIDNNALITVNKKTITVTPEDASGVSAWKFDYSNSYNVSLGQPDGDYLIGDLALKDISLENNHKTISGVEGYFDWEDPEQTLNSSNNDDSYSIIFIPYSSNNYNVFYSDEITLQVSIEKGVVGNPEEMKIYFKNTNEETTIPYDGQEHSVILNNYFDIHNYNGVLKNIVTFKDKNGEDVAVRYEELEGGLDELYIDGLKEVGTYTFTVSIVDKENYCWEDGTTDDATFTVEITE